MDSELLGNRVLAEAAGELGLKLSAEAAMTSFRGWKMANCLAALSERLGRPLPDDFLPKLRARTAEVFGAELQAVPGIHAALDRITIPICVASSGPREKIALTLSITSLLKYFEGRIFSSYDIDSWKPAPDLFLHAAASLGALPGSCAVIEDSVLGVQAAVAAGMSVFVYVPTGDAAEMKSLAIPLAAG